MDTYWNEFSIIQEIWTLLSYFTFSFFSFLFFLFSSFFSLFCFFNPVQRSRLQCKGKFISPYVLCFYKSSHHINVVLHTPSFLSNSSHILLKKSQALESFNDIYKQSKQSFLRVKVGLKKGDQPMIMHDYNGERGWNVSEVIYVICECSLMVLLTGWKFMN